MRQLYPESPLLHGDSKLEKVKPSTGDPVASLPLEMPCTIMLWVALFAFFICFPSGFL